MASAAGKHGVHASREMKKGGGAAGIAAARCRLGVDVIADVALFEN